MKLNANKRLILGTILLVIGCLLPLTVPFIAMTNWPLSVKGVSGGILFFGFEVMAIPAVALMGKDNFTRIMRKVKSWFGMLKPAGGVGKLRHTIGIVMFLLPLIPTYIMAYIPKYLPDNSPERLWVNISCDAIFLASLFILGGDFWDKLASLFVREARAVFPEKKNNEKS